MEWKEFFQIIIIYPLFLLTLIYAIITLDAKGMDTYFLVTFIIAILTIILSIYYSSKTNEVFEKITNKIAGLEKDNAGIKAVLEGFYGKINKDQSFYISAEQQKAIDEAIGKAKGNARTAVTVKKTRRKK